MSPPDTDPGQERDEASPSDIPASKEHAGKAETSELEPLAQRIEAELKPLLQKSPRVQDFGGVVRRVVQIVRDESYSGPLPHPRHFEQFDSVMPGSASRILAMAEKEQAHRHYWESTALIFEFSYSLFGLIAGLIVAVGLIVAGIWTALTNHSGVAIAFVGASAVGMVGAFIKGRDIFEMMRSSGKNQPGAAPKRSGVASVRKGRGAAK